MLYNGANHHTCCYKEKPEDGILSAPIPVCWNDVLQLSLLCSNPFRRVSFKDTTTFVVTFYVLLVLSFSSDPVGWNHGPLFNDWFMFMSSGEKAYITIT